MISIVIVEQYLMLREAMTKTLNLTRGFRVIGHTDNADDAIRLIINLHPAVIILSLNQQPLAGIVTLDKIIQRVEHVAVLVMFSRANASLRDHILKKGAKGMIAKSSSLRELTSAIRSVASNDRYFQSDNGFSKNELTVKQSPGILALSVREIEIIELISEGFVSKEIGHKLGITSKTVEVHRHNIFKKLGVRNTVSLLQFIIGFSN